MTQKKSNKPMEVPMEVMEEVMGTKHLLVDDWNQLGWEFVTLPLFGKRVLTLTNYTEAKAEGGSIMLQVVNRLFEPRGGLREPWYGGAWKPVVEVIYAEGSGPHGIPWWDSLIGFPPTKEIGMSVRAFAKTLMKACADEAQSGYWAPWRDAEPQVRLLFEDRAWGESEPGHRTEVLYKWQNEQFAQALETLARMNGVVK